MTAEAQRCTPFVSMYSDCNEENKCEGCHKCTCSAGGTWLCDTVTDGCEEKGDEDQDLDEKYISSALDEMLMELEPVKQRVEKKRYVPDPSPPPETILVRKNNKIPAWDDVNESENEDEKFILENIRRKRSVEEKGAEKDEKKNENETIIFHHTIDEVNEDTLKNTNTSGTISAGKKDLVPISARRSSLFNNATKPLQIEYSPPLHSQHAADNKVDSTALHDDQLDLLVHHKMYQMAGNQTQATKNQDLSKLVVNELKGGVAEIIGDKNSPVISNITFTPENDTLTAMAFIAGNLLNKLWNMEKDSDDSLETENMKHKKINDLLELFKEPLNLRQETFLKNALQQLSTAIENKNIGNVSLCENIEELKKTSGVTIVPSSYTTTEKKLPDISKKIAATEALNRIGNVLDLIKKYEQTQNTLNDLKNNSTANLAVRKSLDKDEKTNGLTKDEKSTLNVFGNILESLTKIIIPNKNGKKLAKRIQNKNLFASDKEVKDRFPNLNLADMSLTTKDKLALDYLTHIQNNPNCLLNKRQEKPLPSDIEGGILLNLSEFFKIKSMSDLLKLVDSENKNEDNVLRKRTTTSDEKQKETETITKKPLTIEKYKNKENNIRQFEFTKEKLKGHLRTILEDLIELQNISGKSVNGKNIEIAEALPCIYNLLNKNKINNNGQAQIKPKIKLPSKISVDSIIKVKDIVNNLKKELKQTTQTRRTNIENGKIPKSAIVWERTVKNLGTKIKLHTRRNLQIIVPKSFDDLQSTINNLETTGSNTYKSIAYLANVPAAERLLLLKTLALDTKRYISILDDISQFVETSTTLPSKQNKIISEFIENVDINLSLNEKVTNRLDKPKKDTYSYDVIPAKTDVILAKTLQFYKTTKEAEKTTPEYNTVKLSRDQIINQLIKNRMLYYLKMKEKTGDRKSEINRNLAQKILLYLEIGNDSLARELFKIFVLQKKKNPVFDSIKYETESEKFERNKTPRTVEPLIQFEEEMESKGASINQDELIKQLMNIKNMRI